MNATTKTNFVLDLSVFTAFLLLANPHSTGTTIHEWLGIAFAAAIITHLLFHWNWLVSVISTFFKNLFHQSRLNLIVDALFFIAMVGVTFSGILISRDVLNLFGIQIEANRAWRMVHELTANLSVISLGMHTALHWKWIVSTSKKYLLTPIQNAFSKGKELNPLPEAHLRLVAQPVKAAENKQSR